MIRRDSIKECISVIIAILLFLSIPPYFVWGVSRFLLILAPLIIIFLSLIYCGSFSKRNISFALSLAVLYLLFALRDGKNITGIIANVSLVFVFAFNSHLIQATYNKFFNIYSFFLIPSIVAYIYVVFLGIDLPYNIIEPENAIKDYLFRQYPFLILSDDISIGAFRFHSYFDEPGVVGTISGILLLINGLNYKKWQTWALLLSGIFSLSFAFYLLLFFNILFFQSTRVKVIFGGIIITLLIIFANNEIVQSLLLNRFMIENGQVAGINRTTSSMDFFMANFWNSDKLYLGYGNGYSQNFVNVGGASYKDLLINYGIIGLGSLSFLSILYGIKHLRFTKRLFVFGLIWGCIIYQRPFIFNLIYFYLMYIILFITDYQKTQIR